MAEKKQKKQKKRKRRKLKKGFVVTITLIMILLVAAAAVFTVVRFVPDIGIMPIKTVSVTGETPYSDEQVIRASGVELGMSVLKVSFGGAEKNIEKKLPYVKTASVSYSLNGELKITLTPAEIKYQFKRGSIYYLTDDNCKIVDTSSERLDTATLIYGVPSAEDMSPGNNAVADKNNDVYKRAKTVEEAASVYNIIFDVIDAKNENDIYAVYGGKFYVEIGSSLYLEEKLNHFGAMIPKLAGEDEGRILLENWTPSNRKVSLLSCSIDDLIKKY